MEKALMCWVIIFIASLLLAKFRFFKTKMVVGATICGLIGSIASMPAFDAGNKIGYLLFAITLVGAYMILFILIPWGIKLLWAKIPNSVKTVLKWTGIICAILLLITAIIFFTMLFTN